MHDESMAFLHALYGALDASWCYLWELDGQASTWFKPTTIEALDVGERDVYVGPAFASEPGHAKSRIKASNAQGIVGLVADIDVLGDGTVYKKTNLPRDVAAGLALIADFPLPPSMLVNSGHGLQCWWLLQEPWVFTDDAEREDAATLARRWHASLKQVASRHGVGIDSMFDLARIMRLPGTLNAKQPGDLKPVSILSQSDVRYDPSEFGEFLVDDPQPGGSEAVKVVLPGQIDHTLTPPFVKFEALYTNSTEFKGYWDHKRKPPTDDSLSGYDMCLANIAVRVGWTDAEVLALLVAHNVKYQGDIKHAGYYERTIANARARFQAEANLSRLAEGDEAPSETIILKNISAMAETEIRGLIKYTSEPPTYRLLLADGLEVLLGEADVLLNQNRFRTKVMETVNFLPKQMTNKVWTDFLNLLLQVRDDQDPGANTREQGRLHAQIDAYLRLRRPMRDDIAWAVRGRSPVIYEGSIWIRSEAFRDWLRDDAKEPLKTTQLGALYRRYNIIGSHINYNNPDTGKQTSTYMMRLPSDSFAPDEYLPSDV